MISRYLQINEITKQKSVFLLGARQVGKTTLLRQQLNKEECSLWNLLDAATFRELTSDLTLMRRRVLAAAHPPKLIIIDEIQILPELLNEVHLLMEEERCKFVLTGSSARALKRKGVNLLAGRARMHQLLPFSSIELKGDFELMKALQFGLIPSIYFSQEPVQDLKAYAGMYLKEEIAAEGMSRNLPHFSRFLEIAALSNGCQINFTNLASDAGVKRTTVVDWFEVLKDTLLISELTPWLETRKRKPVTTSKFYFFDGGVARHLASLPPLAQKSKEFGDAFEAFVYHELRCAVAYGLYSDIHYWRSQSQFEVDFILDQSIAIEVKAKSTLSAQDFKGHLALQEEQRIQKHIIVSLVESPLFYKEHNIWVLPYTMFLNQLWDKSLSS